MSWSNFSGIVLINYKAYFRRILLIFDWALSGGWMVCGSLYSGGRMSFPSSFLIDCILVPSLLE